MILLSDIHFSDKQPASRTDDVYVAGLNKLTSIFKAANVNSYPIIQAGDLTHSGRNWACLTALISLFNAFPSVKGNFYCVRGQHDMVGLSKDNTIMTILENLGYIKILTNEPTYINGIPVYGMSWGEQEPESFEKNSIFVCHKSISDQVQMFDTVLAQEYIKQVKFKNALILCGDFHKRFVFHNKRNNCHIVNVGPLIRRSINELEKHEPGYYVCEKYYAKSDTGGFYDLEFVKIEHNKNNYNKKHLEIAKEQMQRKIDLQDYIDSIKQNKFHVSFMDKLLDVLPTLDNDVKKQIERYLNDGN